MNKPPKKNKVAKKDKILDETEYLLSNPANAKRLLESIEQAKSGNFKIRKLIISN